MDKGGWWATVHGVVRSRTWLNTHNCAHSVTLLFSHVWPFVTPWTAACQTSQSFTISWNSLKLIFFGAMMPPNHLILVASFSSCPQSFPASASFPMNWLSVSGGQCTGASASVPPKNIQGWPLLGLTGLIFLQSKGLSRVFSIPQCKSIDSSVLSLLYGPALISVWLLEKP